MVNLLHRARKYIFYLVGGIELVISLLAVAGIVAHLLGLDGFWRFFRVDDLVSFLRYLFDALIGVELVKLLCRNDLYSMIEILMFAVTRHLIIQSVTTLDILLGVAAIAILFAVRKFLFYRQESYEKMQRRREFLD